MGPEEQYEHAAQFKDGQEVLFKMLPCLKLFCPPQVVGTLSQDEWEALTIYTVFAFKKIR